MKIIANGVTVKKLRATEDTGKAAKQQEAQTSYMMPACTRRDAKQVDMMCKAWQKELNAYASWTGNDKHCKKATHLILVLGLRN